MEQSESSLAPTHRGDENSPGSAPTHQVDENSPCSAPTHQVDDSVMEEHFEHPYTTAKDSKSLLFMKITNAKVDRNESEDNAIISLMETKFKRPKSDVPVTFKVLRNQTKEEFIKCTLRDARDRGFGNFCRKHPNRTTTTYHCERHGNSKRRDNNLSPSKTRANRCQAYLSFSFEYLKIKGLWVATVRNYLQHNGHDLSDPQEMRVSSIDPDLVDYIGNLLSEGKKPMDILVLCWAWSQSRSHIDFRNRRYYPAPEDIKSIRRNRKYAFSFLNAPTKHDMNYVGIFEILRNMTCQPEFVEQNRKTCDQRWTACWDSIRTRTRNLEVRRAEKGSVEPVNKALYYNYLEELFKVGRLKDRSQSRTSNKGKKRKCDDPDVQENRDEDINDTTDNLDVGPQTVDDNAINVIEIETIDARQLAKQQLVEIFAWLDSEQFGEPSQQKPVLDQIESLHSTIFCNTYNGS